MSTQMTDSKRLYEIFLKVARHIEIHERTVGLETRDSEDSLLFVSDAEPFQEQEESGIPCLHIVSNSISAYQKKNKIFPLLKNTKELISSNRKNDLIIKISRYSDLKIAKFRIESGFEQQYEPNDKHRNAITYYDLERDGNLTCEKASELVFVFAQAVAQNSSLNIDQVMKLLEGPEVDNAITERMTYEDRAAKIAESLAL